MNRTFLSDTGTRHHLSAPYGLSLTTTVDGVASTASFETSSDTLTAYNQQVRAWVEAGLHDVPPSRVLAKGLDRVAIRVPLVPELHVVTSTPSTEEDIEVTAFDSTSEALVACAARIHALLQEGYTDVPPAWEDPQFGAPPPPVTESSTRSEGLTRKFYVDPEGFEVGPEFHLSDNGKVSTQFQARDEVHAWQVMYGTTGAMVHLVCYMNGKSMGPIVTFEDATQRIQVAWRYDGHLARLIETIDGTIVADSPPPGVNLRASGTWTAVDASWRTESQYVDGDVKTKTWYTLDGVLDERQTWDDAQNKTIENYREDGTLLSVTHRDPSGTHIGVSERFHPNGKVSRRISHDATGSVEGLSNPVWRFTRRSNGTRAFHDIAFPWPNGAAPLTDEEVEAFHTEVEQLLADGWISVPAKRVFVHDRHEERRWIRAPVDGYITWFDGELHERQFDDNDLAVRHYNRVYIQWTATCWFDRPPSPLGDFAAPPKPYVPVVEWEAEYKSNELAVSTRWACDPLTDDEETFGPRTWQFGGRAWNWAFEVKGHGAGPFFAHGAQGELTSSRTRVRGKAHGHHFRYSQYEGITKVLISERGEEVSSAYVPNFRAEPYPTYPEQAVAKQEVRIQSGEPISDAKRRPATVELRSNEDLACDLGGAPDVTLYGFEADRERLETFFASDGFSTVECLSMVYVEELTAVDLTRMLCRGHLDNVRHLKLESIRLYAFADGVQEVLFEACLRLPNLISLELVDLAFGTKDEDRVGDRHLPAAFRRAPESRLEQLTLRGLSKVGDATIVAATALPNLRRLVLSEVSVSANGLRAVAESKIETFSYRDAQCGRRHPLRGQGLDVPFVYDEVYPLFQQIADSCTSIDVQVRATAAGLQGGDLSVLLAEPPDQDVFRRILLTLTLLDAESDEFATSLEQAQAVLHDWPTEVKNPLPYFVNGLVDGSIPEELLTLVGCLRVFDLVLDPETGAPADPEVLVDRIERFSELVIEAVGEIKRLDVTPRAWMEAVEPSHDDCYGLWMPFDEAFWEALSASAAFTSLEQIDLSIPALDYVPYSGRSYSRRFDFMRGFGDDLDVLQILRDGVFKKTLKKIRIENAPVGRPLEEEVVIDLPALEQLDMSALSRTEAPRLLAHLRAPRLTDISLRGDAMAVFVLENPFADLTEDQRVSLAHDWGIEDQSGLDSYVFSDEDIAEMTTLAPEAHFLLGGELEAERVTPNERLKDGNPYATIEPIVPW